MADLLGAIANPQMADIAGALDFRAKRLQLDEDRRKEIRTNQLAGAALSSGLEPGSPLANLAQENPNAYLTVSKSMGIDPADGSGMHQMTVDANTINKYANSGNIQGAVDYMQTELDRRQKLGLNTDYLAKGLQAVQDDPHKFFSAVDLVDKTWNPTPKKDLVSLSQGSKLIDPTTGKTVADNPKSESMTPFEQAQVAHWNNPTGNVKGSLSDDAVTGMAERLLQGEAPSKVMGNFGKGKQGPADLAAIQNKVYSLAAEKNIDPNEILGRMQDVAGADKAVKDFDTGKQGNTVRSFNVSLSHLDTLDKLTDALGNGDVPAFNKIGNYFAKQTGSTAPTNFEAAKNIVSDEIVKAIIGAGGGVSDREIAAEKLSSAKTPDQLKGVISTYKELMAGQLKGLKNQYEASTSRDDFEKYLSDEAKPYIVSEKKPLVPADAPAKQSSIDDLVNKYAK